MTSEFRKKWGWIAIGAYLSLNAALFWLDPFSSPWHYHEHHPRPLIVSEPSDSSLTLSEILQYLDEIDIAYGAIEPWEVDEAKPNLYLAISIFFLPSTVALHIHEFMGYLGPATHDQQAFTHSVKARYNHLAQLAVKLGYRGDRYLFELEPSLAKKKGASFNSLASYHSKHYVPLKLPDRPQMAVGTSEMPPDLSIPDADSARSNVKALRSTKGDVRTVITFVNHHKDTVNVYWRNYQGEEILYRTLQPGQSYDQGTYQTHPWVVRNKDGKEIVVVVAADRPESAIVTVN